MARDQEARDHEEDIDADVTAGEVRRPEVVEHHRADRDRAERLEVSALSGAPTRRGAPARQLGAPAAGISWTAVPTTMRGVPAQRAACVAARPSTSSLMRGSCDGSIC